MTLREARLGRIMVERALTGRLVENRERRARAAEEMDAARNELGGLFDQGRDSGVSVEKMCRLAGLKRVRRRGRRVTVEH